ncbi:SDR family oxidoreductase [Nocardia sp. NBC_01377]|uniref:SDR family NAD(P)-dependent oxidoreductase n=1 Tax=Nocardia sp. NBC_01377 TaxID=2903595 RepID=UPI00324DB1DB
MIIPRVAVVTGGASGMGEASCHELAAHGHSIAVLDIDEEGAQRVAHDLRTGGAVALGIGVDVADRKSVEAAFEQTRIELGPVAILVTSAGKVAFGKFRDITPESWSEMFSVNVTGTFHCCQVALPDMVRARWGRIVTISSSSAQRGSPYMAHYAAAKGAVITLTRSLANEFAPKGITVNNIPPSSIDTPMARQSQAEGTLYTPDELAKRIPLGHMGTSDDIAAAVGFLTSERAGFITGQILGVNGGTVI